MELLQHRFQLFRDRQSEVRGVLRKAHALIRDVEEDHRRAQYAARTNDLHIEDVGDPDEQENQHLAALEPYVKVNFGGTVFTKEPIDLGEDGCLELSEESEPNFLGQTVTLEDFMADRFDLSEEQSMGGM